MCKFFETTMPRRSFCDACGKEIMLGKKAFVGFPRLFSWRIVFCCSEKCAKWIEKLMGKKVQHG